MYTNFKVSKTFKYMKTQKLKIVNRTNFYFNIKITLKLFQNQLNGLK